MDYLATSDTDPLGQALLAYRNGERHATVQTWSSLEGWDRLPASRFFRAGAALPMVERMAMRQAHGRVLDLGAGAGCHALSLQRRGMDVVAMDQSPGACRVMRARGIREVRCGVWQKLPFSSGETLSGASPSDASLRVDAAGRFDTVLSLMNGLGLAGRVRTVPDFLGAMATVLAPGGQLLLDSADVQYLFVDPAFAGGASDKDDEPAGGPVAAAPRYMDLSKDHYGECSYRMVYGKADSGLFPWLFMDFPSLADLAKDCGWTAERLYEDAFFGYLARLRPQA